MAKSTYPYIFSNFVWWSDADLRRQLKQRIPGLSDEITSDWPMQSRMRSALMALLQQKGIHAEVLVTGAGPSQPPNRFMPDAPSPSIFFTVMAPPQVLIDDVVLENPLPEAATAMEAAAKILKGTPYNAGSLWFQKSAIREPLRQAGYLSSAVIFTPGPPVKKDDKYLVPLKVRINLGPLFHVASISADPGPLLRNQDVSYGFTAKPGDIAVPYPFLQLESSLRQTYQREGYDDVDFQADPVLDPEHALASFNLVVIPGAQYHVRSLNIENLPPDKESFVRSLCRLRVGDVLDRNAVYAAVSQIDRSGQLQDFRISFNTFKKADTGRADVVFTFHAE